MVMKKLLFSLLVLLMPASGIQAQTIDFDVLSLEALIKDHKGVRDSLMLRNTIEAGIVVLHELVNDTVMGYKEVNRQLDKYQRSFDVINVIVSGACTVMKGYTTYNVVKDRLSGIGEVLQTFEKECLEQGNIETSDTLIIKVSKRMVEKVIDDADALKTSLGDLMAYAVGDPKTKVGVMEMTTARLFEIINNINDALDAIREHVTEAYVKILQYCKARMSPFWNRKVFHSQSVGQVARGALEIWLNNAKYTR